MTKEGLNSESVPGFAPAKVGKRKIWMPVPRFREDKLHGHDGFAL